ncbi:HU family DNA-binding protein [Prevotella copri]|uniref:HU family DNA-binding protein n=1 Tax=Segatella copri TaxID=165179 RepID=UPI0012909D6B|nr:HU family DNA-binding protein [Segatella copri]MQN50170.1 HU family DNA-binding protein [Segatella copri]
MNNKEYIAELAQQTGYSQEDTQKLVRKKLVRKAIDAMIAEFEDGEAVSIPNFGTFEVKKRMERVVVNPTTKKRQLVPPKLVLGFRPVASVKEKLKNGGDEQ